MPYISTRGGAPELNFDDVILEGLATDGGLYVPNNWPKLPTDITADASYAQLAEQIVEPYTRSSVALKDGDLSAIIAESYTTFSHADIAPLVPIGDNMYIMELYHGPTLAFKDFALQVLGRLMDHLLKSQKRKTTIVGATSGDTGSAAIAACQNRNAMRMFILHPKGRTSDVQRRQMTTVNAPNIHNIAIEGTFDDCQALVKAMFNTPDFRVEQGLGAINSINWARVLFQIPYYVHALRRVSSKRISFAVPTGNFGDVFAGYAAQQMGLPIDQLIVATNRNDILARFFDTGVYEKGNVQPTISPSMDIQVASNFERFLFDLFGRNGGRVAEAMKHFDQTGRLSLTAAEHGRASRVFSGIKVDEDTTAATIRSVFENHKQVIDPHTAVGVHAAREKRTDPDVPMVILSTAHAAKFPSAVKDAIGVTPDLPPHMADLFHKTEHYRVLPNNLAAVQAHIRTTSW